MVREPRIDNLSKTVSPTTGDAGDRVSYTVNYSNTGTTNAYDVHLGDTLPADVLLDLASLMIVPLGGAAGMQNNSLGNTIDIQFDDLPAGGSVTVTYDATLLGTVQPGETLDNGAIIGYTSLPGANGTMMNPTGSSNTGAAGSETGERDDSGLANDYADAANARVTVDAASLAKSLVSTSISSPSNANDQAVIGELVQYELVVTLPESVIHSAAIVDTLDTGLSFVSLDSIVTSAGINAANLAIDLNSAATIPTSLMGQTVTFDFGDLTNTNNNAAAETIVIRYTALVQNVAGNQGEGTPGTLLDNGAEFTWLENGNPRTTGRDSAEAIEVIEPDLDVSKSVSPTSVDAADSVTYTIDLAHNMASDTDAFDVTFSDTIPTGLSVSGFTVVHSDDGDITSLFELVGNTIQTTSGSSFDILLGESVSVTVNADTLPAISVGGSVRNTAHIAWTSIYGTDANERSGSGGINNYTDSGFVDLVLIPPSISKDLVGSSIDTTNNASNQAVIGETIQYLVSIIIPEGTLASASLRDTLDSGLEFVSLDSLEVLSGGAATTAVTTDVGAGDFSDLGSFAPSLSGNTLTVALGTIANAAAGDGVTETLTLTYTVRVGNVATNQTQTNTRLDNSALVAWEYGGLPSMSLPTSAPQVEVIEPLLQATKTIDDDTPRLGQTVRYSIDLRHTAASDADAQDVHFTDTLPAEMTLDLGSLVVTGATADTDNSVGNTIDLIFDSVPLGTVITVEYSATVSSDETHIGVSLDNTAVSDWTSLPGSDANERNNRDGEGGAIDDYETSSSETAFVAQPVLNVAKQHVGTSPNATNPDNFDLTIRLVAKNDGSLDLTNLSLIEDLATHFGATFVGLTPPTTVDISGLTGSGVAPNLNGAFDANLGGSGETNLFDGSSGLLQPGESIAVTFVVTLDPDAVGAVTPLANQVLGTANFNDDGSTQSISDLSDDGTDPSSTNPGTPGDTGGRDDPNPLLIPDISLAKAVVGSPVQLANANFEVTYELVLKNTGTVDLRNLQITEDLLSEFGAGVFVGVTSAPLITTAPSQAGSTAPTLASPTWDGNLASSGHTRLFDGTSGFLVPGDALSVRFTVELDPDAAGALSPLDNQAQAAGTPLDGSGVPLPSGDVTDDSDSGTDPSSTNPGSDGDTGGSNDPTPLAIPSLGLAKRTVGLPVQSTTSQTEFDVTYQIVLQNTGNVTLTGIDVYDDVTSEFGSALVAIATAPSITDHTLAMPANLPTVSRRLDSRHGAQPVQRRWIDGSGRDHHRSNDAHARLASGGGHHSAESGAGRRG